MIQKMNKLLGVSETRVLEIYEDTAVIEAYKTGNTDKLNAKDLFVYDKLTKVIDEVITEDMSDYEKEKAIYDWQVKWISYNSDNLNPIIDGQNETHTPYGVFRTHNAICVGNATTFKLFMDALGIPCKIIHSTQNGEHAWNVTQLDGDWYHVDVTFDGSYNGVPGYSYFNVPDSIKDDGSWPWDHNQIIDISTQTRSSWTIFMKFRRCCAIRSKRKRVWPPLFSKIIKALPAMSRIISRTG